MTDTLDITFTPSPEFELASEMETDVAAIDDFAAALARIAETIEKEDGRLVQRLAWEIQDRLGAIEDRRGKLFQLLHPNRSCAIVKS